MHAAKNSLKHPGGSNSGHVDCAGPPPTLEPSVYTVYIVDQCIYTGKEMVKEEVTMLRLSTGDKEVIKAAADRLGVSVTTFITEAALKRVADVKRQPGSKGVHGGVPSWFRATCREAAQGGTNGYNIAGFKLATALGHECPLDLEEDEWEQEVGHLHALLERDDDETIWRWFRAHFPRALSLVPERRRDQFVAGVRRAYDENDIAI